MLIIEILASVFGFLCAFLIARGSVWCFVAGILQYTLFFFVFWNQGLYSNVILQIICFALQFYGIYQWLFGGKNKTKKLIVSISTRTTLIYFGTIFASSIVIGYIMKEYYHATAAYVDAFLLTSNVVAQWLLSKKVLQTWLFWLMVNMVSIGLFTSQHLWPTVIMYIAFLAIDIYGTLRWWTLYSQQKNLPI